MFNDDDHKICYKLPDDYSDELYATPCVHFKKVITGIRNGEEVQLELPCIRAIYIKRNLLKYMENPYNPYNFKF